MFEWTETKQYFVGYMSFFAFLFGLGFVALTGSSPEPLVAILGGVSMGISCLLGTIYTVKCRPNASFQSENSNQLYNQEAPSYSQIDDVSKPLHQTVIYNADTSTVHTVVEPSILPPSYDEIYNEQETRSKMTYQIAI